MKFPVIHLTTLFMFIAPAIAAQKKTETFCNWKILAKLPAFHQQQKALGVAGPVTGVHQNKFFIGGGANFPDAMPWEGGKKKYHNTIYVYEKRKTKIVLVKQEFTLPFNIAYAACCSAGEGIVYAGGENENGISNKVFLLQWDDKNSAIVTSELPPLPVAITNAAAIVANNIVYVVGGETATKVSDKLLALDLNNTAAGWKELPSVPEEVSHGVLIAQSKGKNTSIYLAGGRKKNNTGLSVLYNKVFEFNINENNWKEKKSLPYSLSAGTGAAINPNEILLFGGDQGTTFHKVEILLAEINAEKDETKKQNLILQKNKLLAQHPGFSKEVLLYNIATDTWKSIGTIPFNTPVTTTLVKWNNKFIIPSGEIKAGVRSPNILSVKILQKRK